MRSLSPRELKDMIYMQTWDYDAIKSITGIWSLEPSTSVHAKYAPM
jgi:hypothetical protein